MTRRITALLTALIAIGCVAGVLVPAGLGWDFANFYDAGRRVAAGQSAELYQTDNLIAGQPPQGKTGFYGAPLSAVVYTPMAGLSPQAALIWFKIENVVAFFLSFGLLVSFYQRLTTTTNESAWRLAAIVAAMCLIYQPFWTVFRVGGQTTPTVLLLVTVALLAHTRAQFWVSALCVAGAVLIKPSLAPAAIFLALVSGRQFLWKGAVVAAGAAILSIVALGWPVHLEFLDLMRRSGQLTYPWHFNSSLFILLLDNVRLTYVLQGALLVAIVWLTWQGHKQRWTAAASRHFNVLMALLLFLFCSRTVWEHYLALLFPLLVYVVAARRYFSRRAHVLVAAIVVLSLFQNLIFTDWLRSRVVFDTMPRLAGIALLKSAPLLLTLVFLGLHWREWFASLAAWRDDGSTITLPENMSS